MKKIIALMIILMFVVTDYSITENFTGDNAFCEEINGKFMCLFQNFEENMPIEFNDNIHCYSENLTYNSNEIGGCFSTIKFLEIKNYNIDYNRLTTDEEKIKYSGAKTITETVKRTYYPNEEIEVVIDPSLIDLSKCKENNTYEGVYEYNCNFKGKKYEASGMMLPEKGIFILEMKSNNSSDFLLNNFLYIILIIIIIVIAYSIIKKQDKTIKKSKPFKRRRRR